MQLREAITKVQQLGKQHHFTIIVVGGAMVRLIGKQTTIKKVDEAKRMIYVEHAENPTTTRPEDNQTIVDIDCIAFSSESDPFTREVKQEFSTLSKEMLKLREDSVFPVVSLEPVLYHPYFPKPHPLTQFVSSIESYHSNNFFFRLGSSTADVATESLAPWTYVVSESEQIVSLNPLALQLRYNIRGFSIKPKDKEKIWGKSDFARFVQEFDKKTKGAYQKDFIAWHDFETYIQQTRQPSMQIKRSLWNIYWQTIGTYLAHGTGPVGKLLLPLGNTFFAGK